MVLMRRKFITLSLLLVLCLYISFSILGKSSIEDPEVKFNQVIVHSLNSYKDEAPSFHQRNDVINLTQFPHKILPLEPINWLDRLSKTVDLEEIKSSHDENSSYPLILLYEPFHWWGISGDDLSCPSSGSDNVTCQLSEEINNIEESDVLISVRDAFHSTDMSFFHRYLVNKKLIYFTLESPLVTVDFSITNPELEMFASYWRKSDFWVPYSIWSERPKDLNSVTNGHIGKNYAEGKTKLAAIVVSNCQTANNRLQYVKELQKFMSVDVYGNCGDYDCGWDTEPCFESLKKDYKFYLSFENTNCRDYITEKFFRNALQYEMVPLVMGAKREDYASQAPHKSYIHVEDYDSPEELAKYLLMVDSNDSLYNEYFQWKNIGSYQPVHFLCQVCAMLYELKYKSTQNDITEISSRLPNGFRWGFNNNENLCLPFGEWYWEKTSKKAK